MKKFFIQILALFAIVASIVGGVNYYKDPSFVLHRGEFENQMALQLVQGYSVSVDSNINERLLQRYTIQDMQNVPDGIILGNSQIMAVFPSSLGYDRGYNHGVSGGNIYDFIGILNEYKLWQEKYPKKIALAIDPGMFNEKVKDVRYMEFEIPIETKTFSLTELFSLSYFKASLSMNENAVSRIDNIKIFKNTEEAKKYRGTVILSDGTRKYADGFYSTLPNISYQLEETIETGAVNGFEGFDELSPKTQNDFENLINELQIHNVDVSFIFVPRPPTLWDYIQNNEQYEIFNEADQYLRQLALEKDINIIGSYNPYEVGTKDTDYFDPNHMIPEFVNQVIYDCSNNS